MKKLLIATIFATATLTANAQWYVQGDVGASNIEIGEDSGVNDTVFSPRVSVGYDFGNWRIAGDYTHYGTANYSGYDGYYNAEISLKTNSLGLSAFYDFDLQSNFTPYVGARVSYNQFKLNASLNTPYSYRYSDSASESRVGLGLILGAQYKIDEKISLNFNIEGNKLASDVTQVGAGLGLRYNF